MTDRFNDGGDQCGNPQCSCYQPRKFWIELDSDGEPTGQLCWAYYPDDKPMVGTWIEVMEITK